MHCCAVPFIFLLPHIVIHPCALKICCPCFSLCISLHAALHMKKNITLFYCCVLYSLWCEYVLSHYIEGNYLPLLCISMHVLHNIKFKKLLFYALSSHCCEGLHALHTFLIALLHFTFERCPFFFSAFMADLTSYFFLIKGLHQRVTVKIVQQQKITSSPLMCACLLLADSSQNKFRSTGEFKGFSD